MDTTPETTDSRAAWIATIVLCLVAFLWMETVEITRFLSGRWYLADVANIHYTLVNTLRGRFMESPMTENNHLGYHFTPFLLLLAPATRLSVYPIPLVTAYVLALSLCPLALFRLARNAGLSPWGGVAAGVLFLGNLFVGSVQLANHFESFFILFLLATMAQAPRGGWCFWTAALLALSVKEDAAVWMAGFAALLFWRGRRHGSAQLRRRGLALAGVSAAWLLTAVAVIWIVGSRQEGNAAFYAERAGGIRGGWDNAQTLLILFASTGFLGVFGGASTLLTLAPAPLLLTEFPFTRNLLYYYSYPFIPYLMLASVEGMARVKNWLSRHGWPQRRAQISVALFAASVGLVQVPLATRTDGYRRLPVPVTARDRYRIEVAREKLPPGIPLVVQFGLWGVTPTRSDARMLSPGNVTADAAIFLDLKAPYGLSRDKYLELVRVVMDEVESGRRPLIHDRGEIYIVGPRFGS